MSSRYLHHRCPRLAAFPLSSLSSPLRERQTRVLVVIWLHCYPLCREFGVHSYSLPLLLLHFSFAKCTHTFQYHTCFFHSSEAWSLCLPPLSALLLSLSLSLFSIFLPVFILHITSKLFDLLFSEPGNTDWWGLNSFAWNYISTFMSGENMSVRDRLVIFALARALAFFSLVFAVTVCSFLLLSVLISNLNKFTRGNIHISRASWLSYQIFQITTYWTIQ